MYSAPCTILDAWDTVANNTDNLLFFGAYILVEEMDKRKQVKWPIKNEIWDSVVLATNKGLRK